jgi:xylulokinase
VTLVASEYLLAHDLGTTGDKATLFTVKGELVASSYLEYPTLHPEPTWAEQNPNDWWTAFVTATKGLLSKSRISSQNILGLSFSGQMLGCLPVDEKGAPLRPSIIWMDQRSIKQAEHIRTKIGAEQYYKTTGNRISPTYTISKILWLRENQPAIYKRTFRFLQAKDYIIYRLTGNFVTDYSDASLTGILDVNNRKWAYELLEELEIPTEKLPELFPSIHVAGEIERAIAKEIGLSSEIPVVIGGGDGPCAAVGAGVVRPGQAYNYVGASSWIAICTEKPLFDPEMRIFNQWHLDPNKVSPTGTMQTAGNAYRWLRDEICQKELSEARGQGVSAYKLMDKEAETVEAGSKGILFLPYLMGERSPWWNPNARGVFFGIALGHRRENLIRAVLEGITFNLRVILDAFEEQGVSVKDVRVIGGGARSKLWRRMMADIYGKNILIPAYLEEATSLGAAIAAGVGVGVYRSFEATEPLVNLVETVDCDLDSHIKYEPLYKYFKKLYTSMVPLYDDLISLQS